MRVLLRADAGFSIGTGHVMRCMSLAEALIRRGHEVTLRGTLGGIDWLERRVADVGVHVEFDQSGRLRIEASDLQFDAAVVDSYAYAPEAVSELARRIPTLVIVDGDARGIIADRYLDQNLGADPAALYAPAPARVLAGSRYALVRAEIVENRRTSVPRLNGSPKIVAFMGGSDPTGAMPHVAAGLANLPAAVQLDLIVGETSFRATAAALEGRVGSRLIPPTPDLPRLLAEATIIVSASGTSAWDVCTLGVPSVFIAVVENQLPGLQALTDHGVGLGVDATSNRSIAESVMAETRRLLEDDALREQLFRGCAMHFDGRGAERVAAELEAMGADRITE